MFITKEQAKERLENPENLANRFNIEERIIKLPGKKLGSKNLSIEERTDIAIETRLGEKTEIVAQNHEVREITAAKIKSGARDSGEIDEKRVTETISQVRDKALDRLMHSLGLLDNDKLSGCNAKDLSIIAANMGRVVEKTAPKEQQGAQVNVIIYSPELRKEASFEKIEI